MWNTKTDTYFVSLLYHRYEELLSSIEDKREDLNTYENKLIALNRKKSAADDEMRDLEKSLVEILVDQQKKLLAMSSRDE